MAISADSGHSAASYRYRGSITPRARLLEKRGALGVNKCAKQDALLFVEQNEQRAEQAQQEGGEQQVDADKWLTFFRGSPVHGIPEIKKGPFSMYGNPYTQNDPFGFVIQLSGSISCSVVGWLHVYLLFLRK